MFQSRGGALFFVGLTLVSAATLVGTEEGDGALADATAQIEQQRSDFVEKTKDIAGTPANTPPPPSVAAAASTAISTPAPEPEAADVITEFVPDEELIVDPSGFDPNPDLSEGLGQKITVFDPNAESAPE